MRKEKGTEELLVSADPEQGEYAPVLRVLIAVCSMSILAGVIAAMAALLAIVSRSQGYDKLALSLFACVGFGAAWAVMAAVDKRKKKEYDTARKELLEKSESFKGSVVSCEKHTHNVVYANKMYQEVTYNFVITYKDENGDTVTVKSGRYLNDISRVLADRSVDVRRLSDGEYVFEGFKTTDKDPLRLDVTETEDD